MTTDPTWAVDTDVSSYTPNPCDNDGSHTRQGLFSPKELRAVDIKLDDGLAHRGLLTALEIDPTATPKTCRDETSDDHKYNLSASSKECRVSI